jgi:hypothetical protein
MKMFIDKEIKNIKIAEVKNCPEIVLINFLLHNYPNLKKYLFLNNQIRGNSKDLINQSSYMSSGEQILIKITLDLWDNSGNTLLKDVYQNLDYYNYKNVVRIMDIKMGI